MSDSIKSDRYGTIAVCLHWASALLILAMIPLGFLMQRVGEDGRLTWYRLHFIVGVIVLLLTLLRLVWKYFDTKPKPAPGLEGLHLKGMELVHVLLYLGVLGLVTSGIVLNIQSGMLEVVLNSEGKEFPEFADFGARRAHGLLARVYITLLVSHIGGVLVHHYRFGGVLQRMGVGSGKSNHNQ